MMKYSFIIPVYNCKAYLEDCVASIRAVGLESCEILLIDDGSTDGSGILCDELARQDPRIRAVHQTNAGVSAARNRGIRESSGAQILFIDADDSLDAEALRKILADPRCGQADLVIFGMTFDYYHQRKCYRRDAMYFEHDGVLRQDSWGRAFTELFDRNSLSPLWNKVFQRRILEEQGLLLNTQMFLYEDLEFVLRYMQHCDRIWNVPKAIYHYRQSEDEGNAKRRLARIDSISDFLRPMEAALDGLSAIVELEDRQRVLQQLYLFLARGKIAGAGLTGIRQVCRDFARWSESRFLPVEPSKFQQRLLAENVLALYLADKKTTLRHWLAVRVKAMLGRRKDIV